MFFSEKEKQIYQSPLGPKYDPVDLNNRLVAACNNRLSECLDLWWGEATSDSDRANAALMLAKAARTAFGCKPFDQPGGVLDAAVLEALYDFLSWLSKKD